MKALTPEQEERLAEVWRPRVEGIKAAKKLRNEDPEAFYRQALRLHKDVLDEDNPGIMVSLSALIFEFGRHQRHAEAEPLIGRVFALLRQKPGPKHRGVLQTLDVLASYHHDRGHLADADPYHQKALAAREELLGPNHPRLAATLEKYATLLRAVECRAEARATEERAEAMRGK